MKSIRFIEYIGGEFSFTRNINYLLLLVVTFYVTMAAADGLIRRKINERWWNVTEIRFKWFALVVIDTRKQNKFHSKSVDRSESIGCNMNLSTLSLSHPAKNVLNIRIAWEISCKMLLDLFSSSSPYHLPPFLSSPLPLLSFSASLFLSHFALHFVCQNRYSLTRNALNSSRSPIIFSNFSTCRYWFMPVSLFCLCAWHRVITCTTRK